MISKTANDRVCINLGAKYIWMPEKFNWNPSVEEWDFYLRFFSPEHSGLGDRLDVTASEKILFFVSAHTGGFEWHAKKILGAEGSFRKAIIESSPDAEVYWKRLLDISMSQYISHITRIKERISHIW